MKMRWLIACSLAIAATTVGLVVILSGSDDSPATGATPPTVLPTATAVAIPGVERVPVRWLPPEDVINLAGAREMTEPFAAEALEMQLIAQPNGLTAGPARWAVYVAGQSGPPRLFYET